MGLSTQLISIFRDNVNDLLLEYGWSRTDLANEMEVTKGYVSQVLVGHRGVGLDAVAKFPKALQVEPGELISKNLSKAG